MRRIFGIGLLALAALVLALDVGAAEQGLRLRAVGEYWFMIHKNSLQLLQPAIERHVSPALWDPFILTFLTWPLAAVLAAPGLLLALLPGRRRRDRRG